MLSGYATVRGTRPPGGSEVAKKRSALSFERSLEEFEKLVERMEQGELSLEESLKAYERGTQLSRACQAALDKAEQRIQILTENDGKLAADAIDGDEP